MASDGRFPPTRPSLVYAAHGGDASARRAAWDTLVRAYWKPVYKHLRLRWRQTPEAAQDATQEFFARAMEQEFLAAFDPQKARFRTFLRVCLDRAAHDDHTAARRQKRGGGRAALPLDFAGAENELAAAGPTPAAELDAVFQREWTQGLFAAAIQDLTAAADAAGRDTWLRAFRRYDLEAPERGEALTYQDLARELGATVTQVTNWLHTARSRLRQRLLARLRELCTDDAEFRDEARDLFGGT